MKSFLIVLLAIVMIGCRRSHHGNEGSKGWPEVFHAEQIRFNGAAPIQALYVYGKLPNATLEISPEVKSLQSGIYWTNHEEMTSSQVIGSLDRVLRSQAGVVMQHVDATHIKVTYDASAVDMPPK